MESGSDDPWVDGFPADKGPLCFFGKHECYSLTNDAVDETKDHFYNRLYHILQAKKEKDILILMGDMNAKIGGNNNGYELVMGRHGLGSINENGERSATACADNNLVIGGSIFPHKV